MLPGGEVKKRSASCIVMVVRCLLKLALPQMTAVSCASAINAVEHSPSDRLLRQSKLDRQFGRHFGRRSDSLTARGPTQPRLGMVRRVEPSLLGPSLKPVGEPEGSLPPASSGACVGALL